MAHLAYNLDETRHKVRALDVLVGLVEHDELVERALRALRIAILRVGEELEEHDEQPERFILLDKLVAEVHYDKAPRPDMVLQAN